MDLSLAVCSVLFLLAARLLLKKNCRVSRILFFSVLVNQPLICTIRFFDLPIWLVQQLLLHDQESISLSSRCAIRSVFDVF